MPMGAKGGTEAAGTGNGSPAKKLPSAVAVRDADPGRKKLDASAVVDGGLSVGIALSSVAGVAADGKNELTCRASGGSLSALPSSSDAPGGPTSVACVAARCWLALRAAAALIAAAACSDLRSDVPGASDPGLAGSPAACTPVAAMLVGQAAEAGGCEGGSRAAGAAGREPSSHALCCLWALLGMCWVLKVARGPAQKAPHHPHTTRPSLFNWLTLWM